MIPKQARRGNNLSVPQEHQFANTGIGVLKLSLESVADIRKNYILK